MICPRCQSSNVTGTWDVQREWTDYDCKACDWNWSVPDEEFVRLTTDGLIAQGLFDAPTVIAPATKAQKPDPLGPPPARMKPKMIR